MATRLRSVEIVQKASSAALKRARSSVVNPLYPISWPASVRCRSRPFSARRHLLGGLVHTCPFSSTSTSHSNTMAKPIDNQQNGARPNISIRAATVDDVKAIAELGADVFSVTFGHSVEPHELQAFLDESYSVEAVAKDLADPNRDTILATDDAGDLVGFAMLTRGSAEPCVAHLEAVVELQRIYLYPKAHGTGTGKMLADRLEDMARDQGFKNIWLGVWEENLRARKAYEKWGYRAVGTHDFVVGSVVQTDDILVKQL
ncbi:putative N-acetyltransferase [Colletotrichum trifolii]|uniref:Putative N-acetyltransferase n=1 Tax=Colletotrichum trifolii TaxID=5466 RepID=A0A4R8QQ37_COLTR|nr:putative N-acetyltransferase [Colletotrichum trifolii]